VLVPQREHRMIENNVPKVPKIPVDMKMLTYFQEAIESSTGFGNNKTNSRSNLSSAESINEKLNSKRTQSDDSFDTGGHHLKNDHVYKPFKHEKKSNVFFKEGK
jgi:hypothetical protein